ncbi:MAG TPA: cell division protein ZapA [Methylomirabilota bacterium]|jgi:cell division protein ZapA (FtsZ GTPase activity inhibitor)
MTEGRADVEILGQRLSVRGRGTPEYIHELADYLNERIETVREQARVFDPLRLSLLAGLHVVDELYRCRETAGGPKADGELLARVDRLSQRLGAVLEGRART